jgi:hypothetical protein
VEVAMAETGVTADVELAQMYRTIMADSRGVMKSLVEESDKTSVWIVGLGSTLLLAAVAKPAEARQILGALHFWAILLIWLSIFFGVTYKIANLTLTGHAQKHFFSLECALAGLSLTAAWTDDVKPAIDYVGTVVDAYTGNEAPGSIDLDKARRDIKVINIASKIISGLFAVSTMSFAWGTFLIAFGLWTH